MTTTASVLIIGGLLVLIVIAVLLLRSNGSVIQNVTGSIWKSAVGRHVIVIIVLVLALQAIKSYARYTADQKAGDWLTQYNGKATTEVVGAIEADGPTLFSEALSSPSASPVQPTPSPSPSPSPTNVATTVTNASLELASTSTPSPTPTETESARLKAQLQIIRDRAKHHGNVMAFFYVNYFVSIVMVMTAGLLVAITLFFIAQTGWTATNSHVKATFIVASAYVAFYGLFPPVFQQQKNITDNKELFLHYKSLENEVDSYPITLLTLKDGGKTPREFINHIDVEMDRLGDIALGFDITKVSYEEAFNQAAQPTQSPNVIPPAQTPRSQKPSLGK